MQILVSAEAGSDFVKAEWYVGDETITLSLPKTATLGALLIEFEQVRQRENLRKARRS